MTARGRYPILPRVGKKTFKTVLNLCVDFTPKLVTEALDELW